VRKLCPKLIVLPGDYERYEKFSRWMFGHCCDFTPDVEQTSIDDGYFYRRANHQKPAGEIAQTIHRAIGQSLKISISEGMGSNKLVSQIASKLNKPAAFTTLPPDTEVSFLHPLTQTAWRSRRRIAEMFGPTMPEKSSAPLQTGLGCSARSAAESSPTSGKPEHNATNLSLALPDLSSTGREQSCWPPAGEDLTGKVTGQVHRLNDVD
jgi:hypothetical protein